MHRTLRHLTKHGRSGCSVASALRLEANGSVEQLLLTLSGVDCIPEAENKSEDEDRMPFINLDQPCAASSLFVTIFLLMKVDEG